MRYFIILLTFVLGASRAFGQLAGVVTDSSTGKKINGVIIVDVKTGEKTSTDINGRFYFGKYIGQSPLKFSHVSFRDTLLSFPQNLSDLEIQLIPQNVKIDEVEVSTGYQKIPKERSTGSFFHIGKDRFNEQVGAGVLDRLPAISSGLIADNSTTSSGRLMIRGLSTINGTKEPLIILDNFPFEGDINAINPNDIQDITILKDAAAASIWGVRAGNGVIVITTKRSQYGQKLRIEFTAHTRIGSKPDLFSLETISSKDFIEVEEMLYGKGYYKSVINNKAKSPLTPIVEMLVKKDENLLSEKDYEIERNRLYNMDVRKAYLDHMYRPSLDQQYFLNLRGGTETMRWGTSAGYDRKLSNTYDLSNRFTIRFDNQWKIGRKVKLGADLIYTTTEVSKGRTGYGGISQDSKRLYPYASFADEDGNELPISKMNNKYLDQIRNEGKLLDWDYFPLNEYRKQENIKNSKELLFNTNLEYNLSKTILLTGRYQSAINVGRSDLLYASDSYYVRDRVNFFSKLDPGTGRILNNLPYGAILDYNNLRRDINNFRGQLDYNESFGEHDVSLLFGGEVRSAKTKVDENIIYGLNQSNLTVSNVDFTRQFPNYVTGSMSYIPNGLSLSGTTSKFLSMYSNGAYTYAKRYSVTASARRDATNLFGLRARDKWNMLWSLGGAWNVSNETFFASETVDHLKVRGTHGYSGNIDPSMSAVNSIMFSGVNNYLNEPYARFKTYINPDLKWETVQTTNVAVDIGLLKNRLTGSFEYFIKKGVDLFGQDLIDPTAGVGPSVTKNVANMTGKGFDIILASRNIKKQRFGWDTDVNISYSKDKVTKYYLEPRPANSYLSERSISGIEGMPVYSFYSFKWGGLDPSNGGPVGYFEGEKSMDYTNIYNNTKIEDLNYNGPVLPLWSGSMGNTLSYGDLKLTFRIMYKFGHVFRRRSIDYSSLYRNNIGHSDYGLRWQNAGDESFTDIPSLVYPAVSLRDGFYTFSSVLAEKGDHIRLKYINLSYNVDKLPLSNLKGNLFLNVDNVGILWRANKYGIDPEYYSDISAPPSRMFTIGINLTM